MNFEINEDILKILNTLSENGFRTYLYGECVCELFLGKVPSAYFAVTDAPMSKIRRLFSRTLNLGSRDGKIAVVEGNRLCTLTSASGESFFAEKAPDFTINSVYYSPTEGVSDRFGGVEDIRNGIIRCAEPPEQCFINNPLNMLKLVRYAAVYDFSVEEKTEGAVKKCGMLIKKARPEDIREEMNKILLSRSSERLMLLQSLGLLHYILPELEVCFSVPQKNKYHIYNVGEHIIHAVAEAEADSKLRWAALLHDIGKPLCKSVDSNGTIHFFGHHRESVRLAAAVLRRLNFDSESSKEILSLIENHDVRIEGSVLGVKRMMGRTVNFEKLLLLQEADNRAKNPKFIADKLAKINDVRLIYKKILSEGQPYKISDLQINSGDLVKLGFKAGHQIGETLQALLEEVLIKPELNSRQYLTARAKQYRKKFNQKK